MRAQVNYKTPRNMWSRYSSHRYYKYYVQYIPDLRVKCLKGTK